MLVFILHSGESPASLYDPGQHHIMSSTCLTPHTSLICYSICSTESDSYSWSQSQAVLHKASILRIFQVHKHIFKKIWARPTRVSVWIFTSFVLELISYLFIVHLFTSRLWNVMWSLTQLTRPFKLDISFISDLHWEVQARWEEGRSQSKDMSRRLMLPHYSLDITPSAHRSGLN